MTNRKLHTRFRLVQKSMILNELERPLRTPLHKICVPTRKRWMKTDPHYRRQRCRPMTLVSRNISFMWIYARGFPGEERQTTVGLIFSAFERWIFGTLGNKAKIIYATFKNDRTKVTLHDGTLQRHFTQSAKKCHGRSEMRCRNVCAIYECLEQREALKALTEEERLQLLTECRKGHRGPNRRRRTVPRPPRSH